MRRSHSFGAALVALSLALAGCSSSDSADDSGSVSDADAVSGAAESAGAPESVSIAVRNVPGTFDPHKSLLGNGASQTFDALYDTLVRNKIRGVDSPASDEPVVPAMASSWTVEPDSAVFTLKDNLTCSDGTPLTATDIAASIERYAAPETAAQTVVSAFGPSGLKSAEGDDAANTVTVTLNKPYSGLLSGLSLAFIVCPPGLADPEALATDPDLGATGPYQLTSSKAGSEYTFTRRDSAAIDDPTLLPETLTIKVTTDDTTRANLITSGDVDIAPVLGRDAERLAATHSPIVGAPSIAHTALMNQKDGHATQDKRIREAIWHAVDAAQYTQATTFGAGSPSPTLYTPNTECYHAGNAELARTFDMDKAKELVADAGYGPGGEELVLNVVGWNDYGPGAEYIADSLRQLGATVTLRTGTQDQVVGILFGEGDWDIVMVALDQTTYTPAGPVTFVSDAFGPSLNVGAVANETYDGTIGEASETLGQAGCDLWAEAEAALLENVDVMPLTWMLVSWFPNDDLTFEATYLWVDSRTIRVPSS